ncbi:MAG: TonB family protein, partial [Rhodothermales bacterium]|nr:TonB family protein [Rhodothermales bacterium]
QTPFHAVLAPMKGRVVLQTVGGADLYVDGVLVERVAPSGYTAVVDVGQRAIRLVHPQYGEWTSTVTVEIDAATPIEVDLEEVGYSSAVREADRLFEESRYDEAIESYNRALTIRPGSRAIESTIGLAAKAIAESGRPAADAAGVYAVADTPPELIGGLEELHRYVEYPEEAYNAGVQGRVYVQFVVDENGRAQNVRIAKGLPMGCNEAAIRAVERSRFRPGVVDGTPVKVRQTLFVNFTID